MFFKLLGIRLRSVFGATTTKSHKKMSAGKILLFILLGWALIFMLIIFATVYGVVSFYAVTKHCDWMFFSVVGISNLVLGFISTVLVTQSQIFDARDNDLLLSMPVKPGYIILSRLAALLVIDIIEFVILGVIAVGMYLVHAQLSFAGILIFIIENIGLVMLTSFLSVLFGWIIALITSHVPNKALFNTVLSIAFFLLYIWGFSKSRSLLEGFSGEIGAMLDIIRSKAYPIYAFGSAVTDGNYLGFLIFMLIAVIPFAIMIFVLSKTFIKLSTVKNGTKRHHYATSANTVSSVKSTLLKREWKRFTTSSPYMLNTGLTLIIMLIASVFIIVRKDSLIEIITEEVFARRLTDNIVSISFIVVVALNMFNFITAPSISLEGANLWIAKTIPVRIYDILYSKVRLHIIVCAPFSLLLSAALCYTFSAYMTVPQMIVMMVVPLAPIVFVAYFGLIANLLLPKLDWADEAIAVKQSMSVLLVLGVDILSYALIIAFWVILRNYGISDVNYATVIFFVFLLLSFLMDRYLRGKGSRRFMNL